MYRAAGTEPPRGSGAALALRPRVNPPDTPVRSVLTAPLSGELCAALRLTGWAGSPVVRSERGCCSHRALCRSLWGPATARGGGAGGPCVPQGLCCFARAEPGHPPQPRLREVRRTRETPFRVRWTLPDAGGPVGPCAGPEARAGRVVQSRRPRSCSGSPQARSRPSRPVPGCAGPAARVFRFRCGFLPAPRPLSGLESQS